MPGNLAFFQIPADFLDFAFLQISGRGIDVEQRKADKRVDRYQPEFSGMAERRAQGAQVDIDRCWLIGLAELGGGAEQGINKVLDGVPADFRKQAVLPKNGDEQLGALVVRVEGVLGNIASLDFLFPVVQVEPAKFSQRHFIQVRQVFL